MRDYEKHLYDKAKEASPSDFSEDTTSTAPGIDGDSTAETAVVDAIQSAFGHEGTQTRPPAGPDKTSIAGTLEPKPTIVPGTVVDHYELIRSLGQGGMGQVALARDVRLGRLVALKFCTRKNDADIERFVTEARATAQFSGHENVVTIYDIVERGRESYMALEYVTGKNLRDWLRDRIERQLEQSRMSKKSSESITGISPVLAAKVLIPVAAALAKAHELGIVHRDLKPSNIMITDEGVVKVLDFGIAKVRGENSNPMMPEGGPPITSSDMTRTGAILGSVPYMSPEQWNLQEVDQRTDLWSFGIVLYELMLGEHPLAPLSEATLTPVRELATPMPSMTQRHPHYGKIASIVDRCLRKSRQDRISSAKELLAQMRSVLPKSSGVAEVGEEYNPFAGLSAFQEADADRFFGRERETAQTVAKLIDQPLIAVVGPSGAGKSSFVRAGVIPALKRDGDAWEAFTIRPGRGPMSALADLLLRHNWDASVSRDTSSVGSSRMRQRSVKRSQYCTKLSEEPGFLGLQFRSRARRKRENIVLFVDQFEELFTLVGADERSKFLKCLAGFADDASSPLRVIFSMRSDFLDRIAEAHTSGFQIGAGLTLLPPIDRDGLRSALLRPITGAGYEFDDPDLIEEILDTLEQTTSPLPLLQFTASKLWEHRDRQRNVLTRSSYEQFGGVAGTLASHADAVLNAMSTEQKALARAVFVRLVTPECTRALIEMRELRALSRNEQELQQVLDRLIDARLLGAENRSGDDIVVEIVHESLIEQWPALSQWLSDNKEDAAFVARLRRVAQEWIASQNNDGLLWRGQAAREAELWYERYRTEGREGLGAQEEDYLIALLALGARAQKRRRRMVGALLGALVIIAVVLAYFAVRAAREANHARNETQRAQIASANALQEAAIARNATRVAAAETRKNDPTTAIAILREIEPSNVPPNWTALAQWTLLQEIAPVVLPSVLQNGTLTVNSTMSVAASPDGKHVAVSSLDKSIRIWRSDGTGLPKIFNGHKGISYAGTFTPDSTRYISSSWDHTLRIWDVSSGKTLRVLTGHENQVWGVDCSPDGTLIASASRDKTVRLWDTQTGALLRVFRGHVGPVWAVVFTPDGKRIITGGSDKTIRIWDVDNEGPPTILRGHADRVLSLALSPDGQHIISGSGDGAVRLWQTNNPGRSTEIARSKGGVRAVDFHPDGERILWAGTEPTLHVWNISQSGDIRKYFGHQKPIWSAEFGPKGSTFLSAGGDARIWKLSKAKGSRLLGRHSNNVRSVAVGPQGKRVVSGGGDKVVRVWSIAENSIKDFAGHESTVFGVAFSPDGKRVASAGFDQTVRVWPLEGNAPPVVFEDHKAPVWGLAFSRDGQRLASASSDGTARIRRIDGRGETIVLRGHDTTVLSVAFSPDGSQVATSADDLTVRIWNADGSGKPVILRGHTWVPWRVFFHPDGTKVASASGDGTIRIWNTDGSGEPMILRGHRDQVFTAEFNHDGTQILSCSSDKTVRVWDSQSGQQLLALREPTRISQATFGPDGAFIVTGSNDHGVRIWTDLEGVTPEDPKLWAVTSYCLPVDRRQELLGISLELARANYEACQRRVAAVNASETTNEQ